MEKENCGKANAPICGNCGEIMKEPAADMVGFGVVKYYCEVCGETIPPLEEVGVAVEKHIAPKTVKAAKEFGLCLFCDEETMERCETTASVLCLLCDFAKEKGNHLSMLYHNVERVLSHALQPEIGPRDLIEHLTNARESLRNIMRNMGWQTRF